MNVIAPGTEVFLKTDKEPIKGLITRVEILPKDLVIYGVDCWNGGLVNYSVTETQLVEPPLNKSIGFK